MFWPMFLTLKFLEVEFNPTNGSFTEYYIHASDYSESAQNEVGNVKPRNFMLCEYVFISC